MGSVKNVLGTSTIRDVASQQHHYTSFLEALDEKMLHITRDDSDATPLKTFLIGPKKCGKTSVAMDLVHSLVRESLRFDNCHARSKESNHMNVEQEGMPQFTVVFICHASTVTNNDQEGDGSKSKFPMKISPKQPEISDGSNKKWDKKALSRVSIYYPANFTELVQLLSSIQVLCSEEGKFIGGIVVDDLDQFLPEYSLNMGETGRLNTTPTTVASNARQNDALLPMMLLQIVALAMDVAACIDGIQSKQHQPCHSASCKQSVNVVLTISDVTAECVPKLMLMAGMSFITNISSLSSGSKDATGTFEVCVESTAPLNKAKAVYAVHASEESLLSHDSRYQFHRAQWSILE